MSKKIYWAAAVLVMAAFLGTVWLQKTRFRDLPAPALAGTLRQEAHTPSPIAGAAMNVPPGTQSSGTERPAPIRSEQFPRQANAVAQASPDAPPAVDVAPGFESILSPDTDWADTDPRSIPVRQHRRLELEARDEAWSGRVEAGIRDSVQQELVAQGADTHRLEMPVVECRTTGCEIQAIGYAEDSLKEGHDLQFILPRIVNGAMASDIDPKKISMMVTSLPNDRLGFIAFLPRKQP